MNPITWIEKAWEYLDEKKTKIGLIAFGVIALVELFGGEVPAEAYTLVAAWTGIGLTHKAVKIAR